MLSILRVLSEAHANHDVCRIVEISSRDAEVFQVYSAAAKNVARLPERGNEFLDTTARRA
jgi:hypothetical protein